MDKLMRARKRFGRCACKGHGSCCEVSREIQAQAECRSTDRREIRKAIDAGFEIERREGE